MLILCHREQIRQRPLANPRNRRLMYGIVKLRKRNLNTRPNALSINRRAVLTMKVRALPNIVSYQLNKISVSTRCLCSLRQFVSLKGETCRRKTILQRYAHLYKISFCENDALCPA